MSYRKHILTSELSTFYIITINLCDNYIIKYPILVSQSALVFHFKKNGIAFETRIIPTCLRFLLSDVFRQFHNLFSFQDCSWFGFIIYYGLNLLLLTYSLHFAQIATNVNEGLIFTKCFPSYQIWIIPVRFWLDDHRWWLMGLVFEMSAFGHCVTKWGSGEISEWSPLSLISVYSVKLSVGIRLYIVLLLL